jgi:hypothetical protein
MCEAVPVLPGDSALTSLAVDSGSCTVQVASGPLAVNFGSHADLVPIISGGAMRMAQRRFLFDCGMWGELGASASQPIAAHQPPSLGGGSNRIGLGLPKPSGRAWGGIVVREAKGFGRFESDSGPQVRPSRETARRDSGEFAHESVRHEIGQLDLGFRPGHCPELHGRRGLVGGERRRRPFDYLLCR